MSNAYGVNGSSTANYAPAIGLDPGLTTMSPDTLLEYCRMQLGDLDGQIATQMSAQKTALREREAVQSAQSVLGAFGTAGPTSPTDMQNCVNAIDNAIAQLPPGDPVAVQLADFRQQICVQYKYTPARPLTPDEQAEVAQKKMELVSNPHDDHTGIHATELENRIKYLQQLGTTGILDHAPDKTVNEWQGTTDALGRIADDIKSNAEIQMLQLQDLVSQRQQAVQLASSMMSKEDQTLETLSKAIGQ